MPQRRSKPFKVRVLGSKEPHQLAAIWLRDFVSRGLLVMVSSRIAEPRPGVIAWLEEGAIRLLDIHARKSYRVRLNATAIERHGALYCEMSEEAQSQWVEANYCIRL